jgi:hypothetical protein
MSQATQSLPLRRQLSAHRVLAVSALLALLATVAVVLAVTTDGGSTQTSAPAGQSIHPRTYWNGRPIESQLPTPAAAQRSAGPDESSIAAAIGSASEPATAGRPDESAIAESIGSASDASPEVGEIKVSPSIRH